MSFALQILRPRPARKSDLVTFHTPDYVDFLRAVTPDNQVRPRQGQRLAVTWQGNWKAEVVSDASHLQPSTVHKADTH